jgi:hypothetical protein
MSDTLNGAEPANLIDRPGTPAPEMAAMDLEALTETEAGRHSPQLAPGAPEPAEIDEQTAQAILDQKGDAPPDTRTGQGAPAKSRGAGPLGLWITWLIVNDLAFGINAVLLFMVASLLQTEPGAIPYTIVSFLCLPLILGTMQWLVLKRWLFRFHEWLIPTTAGALFGSIVVHLTWELVWTDLPALLTAIVKGALLGASLGLGQWLALRRRFSRAGWWILATTAGWTVATVGEQALDCLAFLAGSVPAALTGVVLVWLVPPAAGEEVKAEPPPAVTERSGSWWLLPVAGCAGAATGALPGGLILLAVLVWVLSIEIDGGSGTGMGLLLFAGIPLAIVGSAAGALLGVVFGWIGRSIGRKTGRERFEGIGAVAGGLLGGVIAAATVYSLGLR